MNRTIVSLTILAVLAASSAAHSQHHGGMHHGGGHYGGAGHHQGGGYGLGYGGLGHGPGSSVFGSAMAGAGMYMAGAGQFMTGAGQYNLSSSQGAINYQQAYSMALDNRLKYEQTYFQMRLANATDRATMAAARPHFTPQQYAADNHPRIPNKLSPSEWDPSRDVFAWPQTLASDEFADDRTRIETLFGDRDADPSHAGLGTDNYRQIRHAVTMMSDHLHSRMHEISPDEYIPASKFLKCLEHEARFAPGAAMATDS